MNRFQLKLLAVIAMIIDHTGAVLFPDVLLLRMIGRLSFPIYAYFITEGLLHTSDLKKYLLRLLAFAIVSEIPYDLAFHHVLFYPKEQNVFFTLFFGLVAVAALKNHLMRHPVPALFLAAGAAFFAWLFHSDYSWFGVLVIIILFCFRERRLNSLFLFTLANTGYSLLTSKIQLLAATSCLPLSLYNGQKGTYSLKYFFYAIYPVHLIVLFFIHMVVN